MNSQKGQATLEYIAAIVLTVFFIALLLSQIDTPLKQWWDNIARKVAAPCPSPTCVQKHTEPTVTRD